MKNLQMHGLSNIKKYKVSDMNGLPQRGQIYIKMFIRISNLFKAIQNVTKATDCRVRTQNIIGFRE